MKTGNDRELWDFSNASNSAIEESDCLVAFGIGRVYDLCMERFLIGFCRLLDNSEKVRQNSRGHGSGLVRDVQIPEALSALDVSKLVIWIFSAQGWDMEDQLVEIGVSRARIFNFVEFDPFLDCLLDIPREVAFHALPSLITESDVCIDVGANEGLYSIKMATLVDPTKGGKVHAVEPFSSTRRALIRNLEATGAEGVEVHPCALGSGSGEKFQKIFVPKVESQVKGGSARLFPVWGGEAGDETPALRNTFKITEDDADFGSPQWSIPSGLEQLSEIVEVTTLDQMFDGEVRFIKIDVEGFELEVLQGWKRLLRDCQPIILIEVTSGYESYQQVADFLSLYGYAPANLSDYLDAGVFAGRELLKAHQNYLFIPVRSI